MKKTVYAVIAVIVVVVVVAAAIFYQPLTQPNEQNHFYGFESGLNGWTADADVPEDPNNPGHPVNWTITLVSNISNGGNQSVQFFIDGTQDDGTIWLERKLSLEPNTSRNVTATFTLWSESESFNTIAQVVGYVGTKNPAAEGDLQILGAANQVEGWKTYTVSAVVQADGSGDAYVAVGISVRWETFMTYYVDDVAIHIN